MCGNGACKSIYCLAGSVRVECTISLDTDVVEQLCRSGFNRESNDLRPVLVLGTGECNARLIYWDGRWNAKVLR